MTQLILHWTLKKELIMPTKKETARGLIIMNKSVFFIIFLFFNNALSSNENGIPELLQNSQAASVIHIPDDIDQMVISNINDNDNSVHNEILNEINNETRVIYPSKPAGDVTNYPTINTTWNSLKPHKLKITLGSTVLVCSCFYVKIMYYIWCINHHETWSNWKDHIPLSIMYELPQEEVAQELYDAILDNYGNGNNGSLMPLLTFINNIRDEEKFLARCIFLFKWIERAKLSVIFPQQRETLILAKEKIHRLKYLEKLILNGINQTKPQVIFTANE